MFMLPLQKPAQDGLRNKNNKNKTQKDIKFQHLKNPSPAQKYRPQIQSTKQLKTTVSMLKQC